LLISEFASKIFQRAGFSQLVIIGKLSTPEDAAGELKWATNQCQFTTKSAMKTQTP
jgi:hypothetical protein